MPSKPIVVANWKASTLTLKEAEKKIIDTYAQLGRDAAKVNLVFAPTYTHLAMLSALFAGSISWKSKKNAKKPKKGKKVASSKLPKVTLAGQDISMFEGGSKTGEVPAEALKDAGATRVIIGHSERREMGDTRDDIVAKVKMALAYRLDVILCIGEKERDSGVEYLKTIIDQVTSVFGAIDKKSHSSITIAYEPVWAINNKENKSLDAHGLHSMVVFIRKLLLERYGETTSKGVAILYGGSVTPDNAQDILWNGEVQGLLIGRVSFEAESLAKVVRAILINPKKNILKTYGVPKKHI